MPNQNEIRQQITDQIIDLLKSGGVPPWRRPWKYGGSSGNTGLPANVASKKPYRGINILMLESAAMKYGFQCRWWATFKQWQSLGGKVRKRPDDVPEGQWGCRIVFWLPIVEKIVTQLGNEIEETHFIMKSYHLFNVEQVDGPFEHLKTVEPENPPNPHEVYEEADKAISATNANINFFGDRAYYCPLTDSITVPPKEAFTEMDEFYETCFHELVHWTEHKNRLNWDRKDDDKSYAMGELVAELGACFVARELGVPNSENLKNHAAYLKSWLRHMKDDSRFIFKASSQASKASDYILAFSRKPEETPKAVAAKSTP